MIRTILIDDERQLLQYFKTLLNKYEDIEVLGAFINPIEGIEAVFEHRPAVVFMDIEMPQMSGIDAASLILEKYPETYIVFVTAYSQFAVEAFDLNALDYILKPISNNRLSKTIERIKMKINTREVKQGNLLQIKCFGNFQISWEDDLPIKWRTAKTTEIMAYLIQMRNRQLTKDGIIDSLWEEIEYEKADHQFRNAIYYIRKTLNDYGVGEEHLCIDNNYNVKIGWASVDYEAFADQCKKLQYEDGIEKYEEILSIYTGKYYEKEGWLWAESFREELSEQYLTIIKQLVKMLSEKMELDKAERYLKLGSEENPYDEEIAQSLIELYLKKENRPKAIKFYEKFKKTLREDLGIMPNKEIRRIVEGIVE